MSENKECYCAESGWGNCIYKIIHYNERCIKFNKEYYKNDGAQELYKDQIKKLLNKNDYSKCKISELERDLMFEYRDIELNNIQIEHLKTLINK